MMISWKTSLAGIGMILGATGDLIHQWSTGVWVPEHLTADFTALSGGIGMLFAKDHNVTGGTTPQ